MAAASVNGKARVHEAATSKARFRRSTQGAADRGQVVRRSLAPLRQLWCGRSPPRLHRRTMWRRSGASRISVAISATRSPIVTGVIADATGSFVLALVTDPRRPRHHGTRHPHGPRPYGNRPQERRRQSVRTPKLIASAERPVAVMALATAGTVGNRPTVGQGEAMR
jgi:hypothetical protein